MYGGEEVIDAFLYWADRYGFNVVGKSIPKQSSKTGHDAVSSATNFTDFRLPFPFEVTDLQTALSAFQIPSRDTIDKKVQ